MKEMFGGLLADFCCRGGLLFVFRADLTLRKKKVRVGTCRPKSAAGAGPLPGLVPARVAKQTSCSSGTGPSREKRYDSSISC